MKIFLFVSGLAMLSAGIVGAADFATDYINGTLIEYDDKDVPEKQQVKITPEKRSAITPVQKTDHQLKEDEAISSEKTEPDQGKTRKRKLELESYSRGNPNVYDEEIMETPDSIVQLNP